MVSWPKLLIIIVIIALVFGTKKLRTLGSDLGAAIKGFKKAMSDDDDEKKTNDNDADFTLNHDVANINDNNEKKE